MSGRMMTATIGDQRYEIPELWVAGFCQAHKCRTNDAVWWWHFQKTMQRDWERDHDQH